MAEAISGEDVFLAEKVVDSGFGQQDGKRYYKIRWVRYTWEPEDSLSHLKGMLNKFWQEHNEQQKIKSPGETVAAEEVQITSTEVSLGEAQTNTESGLAVRVLLKGEHGEDVMLSENDASLSISTSPSAEDNSQTDNLLENKNTCDVCFRTYTSPQTLRQHKRTHHQNDKSFQCPTCLKYFAEKSTLKRHTIIHLNEKPYKCQYCDRGFSDKSTLRRHNITHTGNKRFVCTNCNKRFTRNEHLRQHMYIHTAEKLYKCDVCSKDFRQRSTLKNHMLLHRAGKGMTWKCASCSSLFETEKEYDDHLPACDEETKTSDSKCQFCDRQFLDSEALLQHVIEHTREHQCNFCNQTFGSTSELEVHKETHHKVLQQDERPFKCVICDLEFMRKGSLLSHITAEHPEQAVYELVSPSVDYQIAEHAGEIGINAQPLSQPVQFVLQNNPDMANNIGQVEIANHDAASLPEGHEESTDELNLQPGENQLLQVELVRMDDGQQFVQSIHTYVQPDENDSAKQLNKDSTEAKDQDSLNQLHNEQADGLVVDETLMMADSTTFTEQTQNISADE